MKTRKIKNVVYKELENGCLIPEMLLREGEIKVRNPKDCLPFLVDESFAKQEIVCVFTLDGNNQIIKKHRVTIGTANGSQIHPREIFALALEDRAVSIILAHNHPSGNMEPSESDLMATKRLTEAGKLLGIPLTDHLIVGQDRFISLRASHPNYFN